MTDMGTDPEGLFEQSGISKEEQAEVLEHIERVATENRIQATPELFSLKEVRRGLLFPIIVDAAALLAIAVAVLILVLVFRHGEQSMVTTTGEYASVEGRLIRALQQESQQRLLDKDQQIASIRAQLADVSRQREDLAANMDRKIKEREEEYRQKIQQELQAERERLMKEGVASDALAGMLATYEAERKAYYDRQLAEYRKQLEEERTVVETQLAQLQRDYEQQISTLQQERSRLVEQYKQRENDLQAQLEQRTRVLDVARVEAIQNLASAQTRLQELSRQQQQTSVVQDQILGQFEQIRAALQANDQEAAVRRISDLRSYLSDPQVASIADISRQREMDLFLLDALQRTVDNQLQTTRSISNLADDLVLLTRLRDTAAQAEQARVSGDAGRAEELYQNLIASIPAIAKAHDALIGEARNKAIEAAADTVKTNQEARRARFNELSTQAAASVDGGQYGAAYEQYRQALLLDPAVGAAGGRTVSELAQLGFLLSAFVGDSDADPTALAAIREAGIDRVRQDAVFVAQTKKVADAREQSLIDRQTELAAEISRLNEERAALVKANAERVASIQRTSDERIGALNETINALRQEIAKLQAEVARLSDFERRINLLTAEYQNYAQTEDRLLGTESPTAILDGKLALEGFLGSEEMTRLFPDLLKRVRAYDTAFQEAGRTSALQDASDIVQTLSGFQTATQRRSYLEAQIARTSNDDAFREFLTQLNQLVR